MTATVVSLESHRLSRPPACGCPRHQLEAMAERAQARLADVEDELLVSRDVLAETVRDVLGTVAAALEDSRRTNP